MMRAVLFVAYRALPFALFGIYDLILLRSDVPSSEAPYWLEFLIFWGGFLLVPAGILVAGGHYVRTLPPRSKFSVPAILFSALLAAINPFVITCWGLSIRGGACT